MVYAVVCNWLAVVQFLDRFLHFLSLVLIAAVEYSATDAEGSTTPDSTDSMAKDVATPDTTRGAEGTCSP